jgi:hypothetical protein
VIAADSFNGIGWHKIDKRSPLTSTCIHSHTMKVMCDEIQAPTARTGHSARESAMRANILAAQTMPAGIFARPRQASRWFCFEHRAERERFLLERQPIRHPFASEALPGLTSISLVPPKDFDNAMARL